MRLSEIKEEYMQLLTLAEDETLDQQIIEDTLESVDYELEEKADAYAQIVRLLESDIAGIDKEIDRLNSRKRTYSNNIKSLKYNLESTMKETGKLKFKTVLYSFGIQKNPPSLVIDEERLIPKEFYVEQEPALNKSALKDFVKSNEVSYAHLQQTESLRIR